MSQPDPNTVRTRILIISDTHSAPLVDPEAADASENDQRQRNKAFRAPLPSADVLLHCGDITMAGHMHEYESALEMLGSIDAPLKLVIAGNHDITLDEDFYLGDSGGSLTGWTNGQRMHMKNYDPDLPKQAKALWTGHAAKSKGVTFLDEGIHEFTLHNGAKLTVYASPWQPEFCNWAFNYDHNHDRWNPPDLSAPDAVNVAVNPVPADPGGKIDIMMTHGPPRDRLDSTSSGPVGCPHLLRAVARARPRVHAWGHIHEAWGVERVEWANGDENLEKKGSAKIWDFMRKNTEADGPQFVEKAEIFNFVESDMADKRGAFVDISKSGEAPLRVGEETLMVNASIMDLSYSPSNAPIVVDLDLSKAKRI